VSEFSEAEYILLLKYWSKMYGRDRNYAFIKSAHKLRNYINLKRGSSVSIVSDYGLDDRGLILDRGRGFFL
jgi:hypothetical protein